MKERWILYFDGACPLCIKSQNSLKKYLPEHIKLTAVDLNSQIAKNKGYDLKQVVLETTEGVFFGYNAWLKILAQTKFAWATSLFFRPCFIVCYFLISKNRKIISKFFIYFIKNYTF